MYISDFKRSLADKLTKNFFSEPSQVMARPPLYIIPGQAQGPLRGDPPLMYCIHTSAPCFEDFLFGCRHL